MSVENTSGERTEPLDLEALLRQLGAAVEAAARAEYEADQDPGDTPGFDWADVLPHVQRAYRLRAEAGLRAGFPALHAEIEGLRADLASLGHWWCPNCEAVPPGVVDDDMCSRCGNQAEWSEPETLTSVKAYAERVKRARDEAWAGRDEARAKRDQAVENAVAWMDEARRQAVERDREYQRAEGLAARLTTVTGQRNDALQMVADLGDMRASLSAAEDARDDAQRERDALRAELVGWAELTTVELTDAGRLHMAEAEPRTRLLVWDCGEQPDLAALRQAITDLSAGQLHMAEAHYTGTQDYAILLSDQPLDEAQATEAYRRRWEGDGD